MGKYDAWGIDDRTGFKVRLRDLKKEWRTGLRVVDPDKRNVQEDVRGKADDQRLRDPSPEPADVFRDPQLFLASDL